MQPNQALLERAFVVIGNVPRDQFTLRNIFLEVGGKPTGSAAYWLAQDAQFAALGLSIQRTGGVYLKGAYMGESRALAQLFGLDVEVARHLFGERRKVEQDEWSDKITQLARLNSFRPVAAKPAAKQRTRKKAAA